MPPFVTYQDTESLYLVLDLATGGELLSVIEHHKAQAQKAGLGPQVRDSFLQCLLESSIG